MIEAGKEVADPLYSTIPIPKEVVRVVDHPLVQRLRRLKQLQTVHRVYPSATHTRFEHSLGAAHLARVFAEHIGDRLDEDKKYLSLIAFLAGLLHDIGHGPYSHTFDDVIRKNSDYNHEKFGHELILNTDLRKTIEASGVDAKEVVEVLRGSKRPLSYVIVNRIYPADILDFVNRDRLHTNVDVAPVKRERLIYNTIADGDKLKLRRKALDTLKTLLTSRRDLFTKVYMHKTSLILDHSIRIILAAKNNEYREKAEEALDGNYGERLNLTDESVIRDALRDGDIKDVALDIISRKLPFKCVYRGEIGIERSPEVYMNGARNTIEDILRKYGLNESDYFIYTAMLKAIPDNPYDEYGKIELDEGYKEYSEILPDKAYYRIYIRVYVGRDLDTKASEISREIMKKLEENIGQGITMRIEARVSFFRG